MSKYRFNSVIIGSDCQAALTMAVETGRWAQPGDPSITPDKLAIATKTEHVVVDRPPRIPAQRIVDWVNGAEPPKQYEQLVLDLRAKVEDPRGPAVVVPLSYREETEVLGQMHLDIGHGYHRPFAAFVLGTAPLPAGNVKAKKVARKAQVTLSHAKAKAKKSTAKARVTKAAPRPRSRKATAA